MQFETTYFRSLVVEYVRNELLSTNELYELLKSNYELLKSSFSTFSFYSKYINI